MTKIEALTKTIYNLENDVYEYDWKYSDSCNCGILARTLLNGVYPSEAGYSDSPLRSHAGAFARAAYCMTTNLPLPLVFQSLKDSGFSHKEILELEMLGDAEVLKKIGRRACHNVNSDYYFESKCDYSRKEVVIEYIKAWVEILQEQMPSSEQNPEVRDATKMTIEPEAGKIKTIHHYHSVKVDNSITEQSKELMLS